MIFHTTAKHCAIEKYMSTSHLFLSLLRLWVYVRIFDTIQEILRGFFIDRYVRLLEKWISFFLRSNSKNALTEHSPRKLTCFQDKIGSTALCPEWLIISLIGVTYALVTRSSWFIDNDWFVCILFNVFLFGKISIQIFKNYDIRW